MTEEKKKYKYDKQKIMRDERGYFLPGTIANPKGRTPIAKGGKPNAAGLARIAIEENLIGVIESLVENALAGDTSAAKILLDRVSPALKSIEHVGLDASNLPQMNINVTSDPKKPIDITPKDSSSEDASDSK
jgi:hypothetical protein